MTPITEEEKTAVKETWRAISARYHELVDKGLARALAAEWAYDEVVIARLLARLEDCAEVAGSGIEKKQTQMTKCHV